jgi:hypothetical protein
MRLTLRTILLAGTLFFAGALTTRGTAQSTPSDTYAALLKRVQQGDMSVDFRAFRIAGTLASGGHATMHESGERAAFRQLYGTGDYQHALDSANQGLARNYASLVNHFDAMLACQALQKAEEAATHEKLVNALLESIRQSGDGKSPETAWFVVTTTEEYIFVARVLELKAKSQSYVPKGNHGYDRLEVIDPKTNQTTYVWFNTDLDMGLYQWPKAAGSTVN